MNNWLSDDLQIGCKCNRIDGSIKVQRSVKGSNNKNIDKGDRG
jgi:hypothetical protein